LEANRYLTTNRLADAWADLQSHANSGEPLDADAYRLAFADPEFLLRRETRGIRFQLEMLKPDLAQQALGVDSTVVVFGSARVRDEPTAQAALAEAQTRGDTGAISAAQALLRNAHHYTQARAFARLVAQHSQQCPASERLFICTGGGPGIMEAANRGAHDEGALSVGLNIALPHEQSANPYVSAELKFKLHYFELRKLLFMMGAKALVAFPGGFGTLDELFEVITLVQCKKARPVPILLFGTAHWKRLFNLDVLAEEGMISPEDLDLIRYVDEPQDAWEHIRRFYQLSPG
jgi:uncharacterized protein (TIGR00730 family)